METDVTIVSNNIDRYLLNDYKDYVVIAKKFSYKDILILNEKKIIFYKVLDNEDGEKIKKLFDALRNKNIYFINVTNNMELSILTKYLKVYDNEKILVQGNIKDIMNNNRKELEKLGIGLPFVIELSTYLQDYGLVDELYYDIDSLVRFLWN